MRNIERCRSRWRRGKRRSRTSRDLFLKDAAEEVLRAEELQPGAAFEDVAEAARVCPGHDLIGTSVPRRRG